MEKKNDTRWMANYEALKAYIDRHHHLPPKSIKEGKWLLNFAKYTRKTIKEGKCAAWKKELFENLMAERTNEHTGGRKKKVDK